LAALLGIDAGIGAGGVDEGDDRYAEAIGSFHETHRLAIAFRARHAEIVLEARLGVIALFLADDHDRLAAKAPEPADDGIVLGEFAIASHGRVVGDEA